MPTITHALSVQQPWARALLVSGTCRKPLENRYNVRAVDRPPFPVPAGWLGIHAGLVMHLLIEECLRLCPDAAEPPLYERGALIGAVHVVGWRRASEALRDGALAPWVIQRAAHGTGVAAEGWCLVTDAAARLEPVRMRGMLGRFRLPAEVCW